MSLAQFFLQGDALARTVALLLLAMSVATWVVIVWKTWLVRRASGQASSELSHGQVTLNPGALTVTLTGVQSDDLIEVWGEIGLLSPAMRLSFNITGTSSPAIRAVRPARGPEALTTVPTAITAPDFSVTEVTRAPSRPMATTSSVT